MIDLLGFLAATLTTASFLPQVVKTWRTGSARDLSLAMLLAFAVGVGCWLAYALLLGAWPMILGNGITLALALVLLVLKLLDRPQNR